MGRLRWIVLLGFVGACGGGGSDPPQQPADPVISFLRHDNADFAKAEDTFFAGYTASHPTVVVTPTTVDYFTLVSRLLTDLTRDQFTFDLVLIPPSWVCSFAANLADVPANVVPPGTGPQIFFAGPLAGSTCNGVLKAVPVEYNLEYGGVIVNVDKYQAKFPGKSPGWPDWNTFIAEASALTEYDAAGVPRANGLDIDPQWPEPVRHILLSQILQRGGTYWSPAGNTFDFNTQAARDSLAFMASWITVNKIMFLNLVPPANTFVTNRLAQGATGFGWNDIKRPLSVMGYIGSYGLPQVISQIPMGVTTHYDYFTLPPMVGTQQKFVQNSGWAFAVPRTSRNAAAAWDVVKALALSPDAMRTWSATAGTLPALLANGTPQATAGDPLLARVQPLLPLGQWIGYVPAAALEQVEGAMVTNFFAVVNNQKSVEQALADMQMTANNAIMSHQ
jgi:multiple sugar transport system substrate-binding protein